MLSICKLDAQDPIEWLGINENFNDGGNWSSGRVPGPGDTLMFPPHASTLRVDTGNTMRSVGSERMSFVSRHANYDFVGEGGFHIRATNHDTRINMLLNPMPGQVVRFDTPLKFENAANPPDRFLLAQDRSGGKVEFNRSIHFLNIGEIRGAADGEMVFAGDIILGPNANLNFSNRGTDQTETVVIKGSIFSEAHLDARVSVWSDKGFLVLANPDGPAMTASLRDLNLTVGGKVRLRADDQINCDLRVTNPNTTFLDLNGFSNTNTGALLFTEPMQDARLVIDFSNPQPQKLHFSVSAQHEWGTLPQIEIRGFKQGRDELKFGDSRFGLLPNQIAQITFDGKPARMDSRGFITPR